MCNAMSANFSRHEAEQRAAIFRLKRSVEYYKFPEDERQTREEDDINSDSSEGENNRKLSVNLKERRPKNV